MEHVLVRLDAAQVTSALLQYQLHLLVTLLPVVVLEPVARPDQPEYVQALVHRREVDDVGGGQVLLLLLRHNRFEIERTTRVDRENVE